MKLTSLAILVLLAEPAGSQILVSPGPQPMAVPPVYPTVTGSAGISPFYMRGDAAIPWPARSGIGTTDTTGTLTITFGTPMVSAPSCVGAARTKGVKVQTVSASAAGCTFFAYSETVAVLGGAFTQTLSASTLIDWHAEPVTN